MPVAPDPQMSSLKPSPLDQTDWEKLWEDPRSPRRYLTLPHGFEPILEKYLPRSPAGRALEFLEIGCYPGRFLYYFAKEFGYRVAGVDFVAETAEITAWLAELGVEAQVVAGDFFHFQPQRTYDVVASFGFVEHFPNWEDVLDRHLALLGPGGTLVIEFPNFRYGQYWLRRFLQPEVLEGHCLEVMDPGMWARALEDRGLEIIYRGYYQTFRLWGSLSGRGVARVMRKVAMEPLRFVQRIIKKFHLDYPNRYFSPYCCIIARRPLL
ncbi:MAG: methyltransferase domain-containing protein [Thermodesulfobacteriota bacterium]